MYYVTNDDWSVQWLSLDFDMSDYDVRTILNNKYFIFTKCLQIQTDSLDRYIREL